MTYSGATTILGPDDLSAENIQAAFLRRNPQAPDLGTAIHDEAVAAGIRPSFIAAEIMDETANWTSARALQANNPSGLGATDDGAWGETFATPRAGIHATCAHWLTYILGTANPLKDDDPRYQQVLSTGHAGTITTIGQIGNGIWATSPNYADEVLTRMNAIMAESEGPTTMNYGGISNLVDIRSQLQTNPNGYPNARVTLSQKVGLVVHYNGPPVEQPGLAQLKGDAAYHCNEIWGYDNGTPLYGDGLMYHLGIVEDGTVYLCRDFEDELYHCAAWPQNATALAVEITIGDGQHATAAQLASLKRVADAWHAAGHMDANGVTQLWGHQELSPTSCPGTLMNDFVYPYRAGTLTLQGASSMATYVTFSETGHGIGGGFLAYWQANGGVRVFGYPLTEEVQTTGDDGKPLTVQYFERARFEWHPKADPANFDVELTRLGAAALTADTKTGKVRP